MNYEKTILKLLALFLWLQTPKNRNGTLDVKRRFLESGQESNVR